MSTVKWIHVLKRIEKIEQNIEELIQIEKSISPKKEYYEPLLLSIEQQINHFVDERIKLRELKIENPPEYLLPENQTVDENQEENYSPSFLSSASSQQAVQTQASKAPAEAPQVQETQRVQMVDETVADEQEQEEAAPEISSSPVSSIEKFARSLDVNSREERSPKTASPKAKETPKSRQDILNDLSQIDY